MNIHNLLMLFNCHEFNLICDYRFSYVRFWCYLLDITVQEVYLILTSFT